MIQAIKPATYEAENRFYRWDKEEEERFARSMAKAKSRLPAMPELPMASNANFDNPAFNIIAGPTNYLIRDMVSEAPAPVQLDLFRDKIR